MPDLLATPDAELRDRPLELTSPAPLAEVAASSAADVGPIVLAFDRVSKWYGPVLGLNQVSLELRPGVTGLVGHNGAGKSTLLNLAAGLTRPDLGQVTVTGLDAWTPAAKRHLGFVPELDHFFEDLTGRRFLDVMARLDGLDRVAARNRVGAMLDLVGMSDRADRPLGGYSKGMRQRIKLAQALLHNPPLLLLDEPLNGIDPVGRREMVALFRVLADQGKCLLVSSHELDALEKLTDHVAIVASGRLAAVGTVPRIRELLDDHPHTIHVACDRGLELSRHLLEWDNVLGLDRDAAGLTIRVKKPRVFFEKLGILVREEQLEIQSLETLDDKTHDVLGYLLGGRKA